MLGGYVLDLRSIILVRFLLGIYLCYDVWSRITPWGSIHWYTSDEPQSFLAASDTPHGNVIHLLWFYRGSAALQYTLFTITFCLSILFAIGKLPKLLQVLHWLLVVAMQCRNMHVHDGSDNFTRQLLFWYLWLPKVNDDDYDDDDKNIKSTTKTTSKFSSSSPSSSSIYISSITSIFQRRKQRQIKSLACLGVTTMICCMYLGTVAKRLQEKTPEWLPPDLSSIHYILRDSFAIRNHVAIIRPFLTLELCQFLTVFSLIIETLPIVWIFVPSDSHLRVYATLTLLPLHLGMLLCMRLPNWQFVAMIASLLWIPTPTWNHYIPPISENSNNKRSSNTNNNNSSNNKYSKKSNSKKNTKKKTKTTSSRTSTTTSIDTDTDTTAVAGSQKDAQPNKAVPTDNNPEYDSKHNDTAHQSGLITKIKLFFMMFFYIYMIFNWFGERKWIPKLDGGDIGEFFRLSQYWVMYSTPPKTAVRTHILGYSMSDSIIGDTPMDVMHAIRTNNWEQPLPLKHVLNHDNHEFVISPRWERALDQFGRNYDKRRAKQLLRGICHLNHEHDHLHYLELTWTYYSINPPTVPGRWTNTNTTVVIPMDCVSLK